MTFSLHNIIQQQDIDELLEYQPTAVVAPALTTQGLNTSYRDAESVNISGRLFPEVKYAFESTFDLSVTQMDFLMYNVGGHFNKHCDTSVDDPFRHRRILSTVTMLDKSSDLVGGDLIIEDSDGSDHTIRLDIGQTVSFDSTLRHTVTPVERGYRIVLVTWLGN